MATLEIGVVQSSDDFVISGSGVITHQTAVPTGAEVVGGGFLVENLTNAALSMSQVVANGPSADEWVVTVQPNASVGHDVRLTVYATYAKVT